MDQLTKYRQTLIKLLKNHSDLLNRSNVDAVQTYTIFDEARDHYMLFRAGWLGKQRIHTPILYVRLAQGKLWIEEDYTEDGIATELVAAGIPKTDIVLAFRHPSIRPLTEFAVA
jgi:hypothetical protein